MRGRVLLRMVEWATAHEAVGLQYSQFTATLGDNLGFIYESPR